MKKLVVIAAAGLMLVGCTPAYDRAAEDCGGDTAGITVTNETLEYDQADDSTGDAWICLLETYVPKKSIQYAITQDMQPGESGMAFMDDTSIIYGTRQDGSVILSIGAID